MLTNKPSLKSLLKHFAWSPVHNFLWLNSMFVHICPFPDDSGILILWEYQEMPLSRASSITKHLCQPHTAGGLGAAVPPHRRKVTRRTSSLLKTVKLWSSFQITVLSYWKRFTYNFYKFRKCKKETARVSLQYSDTGSCLLFINEHTLWQLSLKCSLNLALWNISQVTIHPLPYNSYKVSAGAGNQPLGTVSFKGSVPTWQQGEAARMS